MSSQALVPAIRFKDFTDPWEQRKFLSFVLRESNILLSSAEYPSVEYEDVVAEEGRLNKDVRLKETHKIGIVFDGHQILYGKLRPYLHNWLNPDFCGVAVGDWWVLRPIGVDKVFLFRLVQTQRFDSAANQSAGSKMPRADWKLISNTEFIIPTALAEQRKIAKTFDNLDNLITLHQRKLDKIKCLKKALLEKLFPAEGEVTPKIRFKGFTDPWEQRKLGKEGTTFTGLSGKRKEDFGHGDACFVTYMNVFKNPLSDPLMVEPIDIDSTQQEVKYGDIFFTTSSETPEEVGMSSIWTEKTGNTYLNSFCFGYRLNNLLDYDLAFLAFNLRADTFRKNMIVLAQGISRYNISKNKAMNLSITVPAEIKEQTRIGNLFLGIDSLITLHQRKLEKLKNIKKSLLEKMFVS